MRVLFASPGAYGHVHPMIPLAGAVERAGHTVHWVTSARLCERLVKLGFRASPVGLEDEQRLGELRRRYPHEATLPPEARRELMFPKLFGAIAAPAMLPGLLAAAGEFRPDVVVHGAAEFASPIVAAQLGIPHVTHGFGAPVRRDLVESASTDVEPLWASMDLEPRAFGGSYDHLYLDIYPAELQPASLAHIPRVQPLRPEAADAVAGERLPDAIDRASPPIVYVTFGTVFTSAESFGPVLEAAARIDATFVVTVGPKNDPAALGPVTRNVVVERYLPQSLLFDRCAAVASHAGSGTFLAALARGIPQVCLPQAADQFVNAAACERVGAGVSLVPEAATADAVTDALARVLGEPSFREQAAVVAASMAAMPSPDDVVAVIEQVA